MNLNYFNFNTSHYCPSVFQQPTGLDDSLDVGNVAPPVQLSSFCDQVPSNSQPSSVATR